MHRADYLLEGHPPHTSNEALIDRCRQGIESRRLQLGDLGGDGATPGACLLDRLVGVLEEQSDPTALAHCAAHPVAQYAPLGGAVTAAAQSMLGSSVAVGHVLKQSLVALGEAQRQQSLREIKRRFLWRYQETGNLRRTPEQWREVQRRSRGPPCDIAEIPLDSKALLDPRETLSALYVSRMRLQGHKYHMRDDPIRWAHFWRFLRLLHQHAPPARTDYVQPRHLWEVPLGKARGPDLRLPEADVCIDISWYRHLTQADQYARCAVMRSPPVTAPAGTLRGGGGLSAGRD